MKTHGKKKELVQSLKAHCGEEKTRRGKTSKVQSTERT
jgi:hypothetical protein